MNVVAIVARILIRVWTDGIYSGETPGRRHSARPDPEWILGYRNPFTVCVLILFGLSRWLGFERVARPTVPLQIPVESPQRMSLRCKRLIRVPGFKGILDVRKAGSRKLRNVPE